MNPTQDYKQLLSEVIKKQIVILGPDITLAKARNVAGLEIADDGSVLSVSGNPQEITQKLIDQFVQLSGLIVKKTMEPLLTLNQSTIPQTVPTSQVPQPAQVSSVASQPAQTAPATPTPPSTQATPSYPLTGNPEKNAASSPGVTDQPVSQPEAAEPTSKQTVIDNTQKT